MQGSYLYDRPYSFVLMALILAPREIDEFINLIGGQENALVREAYETATRRTQNNQRALLGELKKLLVESRRSSLSEIHPDWILEFLLTESPRVIGAILRYLPDSQARTVLDHLPPDILDQMPPLSQTFSLDPELTQKLKKNFEKRFLLANVQPKKGDFDFSLIPFFSGKKLVLFFRELGFNEMAMAFGTLNEKTVNLILRRLPPRDAASLKKYLQVKKKVDEERLRQAQSHLLSLDLQKGTSEHLVIELGFYLYAKSLLAGGEIVLAFMEQKLPLNLGRLLRHYVERNLTLNVPDLALKYQREALEIAVHLYK